MIGMRYHPAIFSAKVGTPFVSIAYEHKMEGFLEKMDLRELMIKVEDISAEEIIEKFKYMENNYNIIKNKLKVKNPVLTAKSQETTDLILESIKNLE